MRFLISWACWFGSSASCLFFSSCRHRDKSISFYYWRTSFHIDSIEHEALTSNLVQTLYTRYFDVDFLPGDSVPKPVAPISLHGNNTLASIIPVIYIKNRVFTRLDTAGVDVLAQKIYSLAGFISASMKKRPTAIQFDCDWTENTRDKYFLLLRQYKAISKQPVAATIRLHQIKYSGRTGIPPVDHGVLMYYNMGDIDAGFSNSIYDQSVAAKYNAAIKNYPLILDIALPIFAWALQVRDGRVVKLLNKMNFLHFENDTNFISAGRGRYAVKHAGFHGGYYFKENDTVKAEHVSEKDLMTIITQVNRYSNHRIRNLIFYDLDKENLALYDKDIFRKVLDHLD